MLFRTARWINLHSIILAVFGGSVLANPAQTAEIHRQVATFEDGAKLRYTIAIPHSFATESAVPLILALHYGGEVTPFFGSGILTQLVAPALAELGAIIVAPDCPGRSWADPVSESQVMKLLEGLILTYPVDHNRILVTGYSKGAAGTWFLAGRHPDFFCAALPISGAPPGNITENLRPVPFYVIHSRRDETIPLARAKKAVRQLKKQKVPFEFIVLDNATHYDISSFIEPLTDAVPWIQGVCADAN